MKTEIINTGSELLTGETVNANAQFLAGELLRIGIPPWRQTTLGDVKTQLVEAILKALEDSELVFITGGLGPTTDDITKEAVAEVLGKPMVMHQESLKRIQDFFAARDRAMPEPNRKQALIPKGSIVLNNDVGTAPGLVAETGDKALIVLPGPPMELKHMFLNQVLEYLLRKEKLQGKPLLRKVIKLWGIGESIVQEQLADLEMSGVDIAYQARRGEVLIKLTPLEQNEKTACRGSAQEHLKKVTARVLERLGKYVFGFAEDTMESVVAEQLLKNKLTISLAESCTGGLIAKKLTDLPGSSEYLMYGVVSYSNEAKSKLLGVKRETLAQYGAVSEQTALEMAEGVRKIGNTDLAVSITGIAGPGGGSKEKPVGLVYIGLSHKTGTICREHLFYGDRENVREMTARAALNMVRSYIAENYSK